MRVSSSVSVLLSHRHSGRAPIKPQFITNFIQYSHQIGVLLFPFGSLTYLFFLFKINCRVAYELQIISDVF
jgi:hypothetical protein